MREMYSPHWVSQPAAPAERVLLPFLPPHAAAKTPQTCRESLRTIFMGLSPRRDPFHSIERALHCHLSSFPEPRVQLGRCVACNAVACNAVAGDERSRCAGDAVSTQILA